MFKVGATSNMEARVAKLQTGNPRQLWELAFFPQPSMAAALALEGAIHRILSPVRAPYSKEWFLIPPEQMTIIAQVVKASPQLGELVKVGEPMQEKEYESPSRASEPVCGGQLLVCPLCWF
jgi:hypothetical protein